MIKTHNKFQVVDSQVRLYRNTDILYRVILTRETESRDFFYHGFIA